MLIPPIKSKIFVVLLSSLILWAGCKTTHAPDNYLRNPQEMSTNPYGGWADVYVKKMDRISLPPDSLPDLIQTKDYTPDKPFSGEMVAVSQDSLFLNASGDLYSLPKAVIKQVDLQGYHSGYNLYFGITILGTLSTISHGWGLFISAPLWIILGTIFGTSQAHVPVLEYPDRNSWGELRRFARFPQGFPKDMTKAEMDTILSKDKLPYLFNF